MEAIIFRTIVGSVDLVSQINRADWIFDAPYLSQVIVGMNDSMSLLNQTPGWLRMGNEERNEHLI